jgi:hypothetical protein
LALTSECSLRLHPFKLTRRSTRFVRQGAIPWIAREGRPEDPGCGFSKALNADADYIRKMLVPSLLVSAPENPHHLSGQNAIEYLARKDRLRQAARV